MNREKARRKIMKYRLTLAEPVNDKLSIVYSVRVTTIRLPDEPVKKPSTEQST
ncbi:hypothetical protein [Parabacteroides bouchesdurhonensis]|uniref:hypothetical protein n=1 Tax=Parabacteroides bouchesdurhonensis TaxID=1936995 RepID=UPI00164E7375|nr:hypothetical protein [Parabacteroides bouchesdurhonensis]